MRPVAHVGQGDSIQDWYANMPFVTKLLVTSTVALAGLTAMNVVNPHDVILNWDLVIKKFQIWRLFTAYVFAGSFSFNFLMHTVVLYENCRRYEANPFNTGAGGNSADFLFMVLIGIILLGIVAHLFEVFILSVPLLYMIMYVWSRRDPDALINFYGFKFQGLYLPWIYIAIQLLMGASITLPIIGIAVGHVYYFLIEVLPATYGREVVKTPKFVIELVSYITGAPTVIPRQGAPAQFGNMGGGHNWGRGRALGAN